VTASLDADRPLLAALARRHTARLPVRTITCLTAAVDELTDPLTPPPPGNVSEHATTDPASVIAAVRSRLLQRAQSAPTVAESLSCARAARELGAALLPLAARSSS